MPPISASPSLTLSHFLSLSSFLLFLCFYHCPFTSDQRLQHIILKTIYMITQQPPTFLTSYPKYTFTYFWWAQMRLYWFKWETHWSCPPGQHGTVIKEGERDKGSIRRRVEEVEEKGCVKSKGSLHPLPPSLCNPWGMFTSPLSSPRFVWICVEALERVCACACACVFTQAPLLHLPHWPGSRIFVVMFPHGLCLLHFIYWTNKTVSCVRLWRDAEISSYHLRSRLLKQQARATTFSLLAQTPVTSIWYKLATATLSFMCELKQGC